MLSETKYASNGNKYVAYQVIGEGPIDLVWVSGTVLHLDLDWNSQIKTHFFERLATFCRLIRFDRRGIGLSDNAVKMATLEERTDDILAVMNAAGSQRAVIVGLSGGTSIAALFAATYPERTQSLVIWGGQARWTQTGDYPWGQTSQNHERMIQDVQENWPSIDYITGPGSDYDQDIDPDVMDAMLRYFRSVVSAAAITTYERMNAQIDIRDVLPMITVPTLVMNRVADPVVHIDAARDFTERIPCARLVELPGRSHSMFLIDPERVALEIEKFVTGGFSIKMADRVLATILFIDIVQSTERVVEIGDAAWHQLLDAYYAMVRAEIAHFRGSEMDCAGDGFFAIFDGPARAICCAIAIKNSVRQMGMEVRAGVHTGECEPIGEKVGGIAVHIAARILSKAAPSEVVVSSTVKELVTGSGIEFEDRGPHILKGVPGNWHLYEAQ